MKNIRTAEFNLKGLTPLLMHADDVEASDLLKDWRKSPGNKNQSVAGDDRSPAWTWQTYWYLDEKGNFSIPSDNLMRCLCKAGAKIILKKQTSFKELTQTGLCLPSDTLDFRNAGSSVPVTEFVEHRDEKFADQKKRAQKAGFDLLVKRASVGQSKHVRVRPMFRSWSASGTIQVTAQEFDSEKLQELFELAGTVGLGDWRPGSKTPGRFGMFEATVKFK